MVANNALRDKLSAAKGRHLRNDTTVYDKSNSLTFDPLPNPMTIGEDGVDHINIWEQGETDLGKALAHATNLSFVHSRYGRFSNIESFWHYIRSSERDDRIRTMIGKTLKQFAYKLTPCRVPNFRAIIMNANYQKLVQNPEIIDVLVNTDMPFDCYYIYRREDGIRVRPNSASWIISGFNEIRKAFKEEREPDLSFLRDDTCADMFAAADTAVNHPNTH